MTLKELQVAARELGDWLEWDQQVINDAHRYGHMFDAVPGENVYEFILRDALKSRGLTLEQFRDESLWLRGNGPTQKTSGGAL